jgi:hypothetical protein
VPQAQLILTCSLSGSCDHTKVQALLEQYGLHAQRETDAELRAEGAVPVVLERMRSADIEAHLIARIEDAVPGTRVSLMRATVRRS